MSIKLLTLVLMGAVLSLGAWADTVCLLDGTEINGTIIEENRNTVVIRRANGTVVSVRRADVDAIVHERKAAEVPEPARKPAAKKEAAPTPAVAAPKPPAATPSTEPVDERRQALAAEIEAKEREAGTTAEKPAAEKPAEAAKTEQPDPKEGEPAKPETKEGEAEKPAAAEGEAPKGESKETPAVAKKAEPAKKADPAKKEDGAEEEEEWTAPPGLAAFPDHAKRMSEEKEAAFMAALENLRAGVDAAAQRDAAKNEIAALGAPVIPYVVAGCYDGNVDARTACMSLLGQLSARNAVKQAIEVFFAAMPESGEPASYQVPFLRAVRTTLPILTGQSFINVEPSSSLVQNGLRDYIKWYEDNYDRLPPQLGEKKLDATDPEYLEKLQEARKLKLEKKSWPRPPMSADMVGGDREGGRPQPRASDVERPADQSILRTIPKLSRDDAFRRR